MELFGFSSNTNKPKPLLPSFVAPSDHDGTIDVVSETNGIGMNFSFIQEDKETFVQSAIKTYRNMVDNSDVNSAIEEVVDSAIVNEIGEKIVSISLDNVELSENIKNKIRTEFDGSLKLLNFVDSADDLFRRWYVDGRILFHMVANTDGKSIAELRPIDPTEIKKVQEITKTPSKNNVDIIKSTKEYYVWTPDNLKNASKAVKIDPNSILVATSGLRSKDNKHIVSYLHSAIKSYNRLNSLEDSLVVYRIARAPERRVFYVDTGNLPPKRAEQYMRKIINQHKNKTVYDSRTGSVKDNKHLVSMLENLWMPRMDGSRGTEVESLPSGTGLGDIDDILYFEKKLYKALHIPTSRLDTENSIMAVGRQTEISREELKFNAFIDKLRKRFSKLFRDLIKTQIILKKVMTAEEWRDIEQDILFEFNSNSYFAENKKAEIMTARLELLSSIDDYTGKYMSIDYVRRNVLQQTDEDIKKEDEKMKEELDNGKQPTEEEQ